MFPNDSRCFFDVCDGIFLNYTWKDTNLEWSAKMAQHRILDVFVGVDVFGRNCFGGGGFNSHAVLGYMYGNHDYHKYM